MLERLAAWLCTGPIGVFTGGALDWLEIARRVAWARLRGRRVQW